MRPIFYLFSTKSNPCFKQERISFCGTGPNIVSPLSFAFSAAENHHSWRHACISLGDAIEANGFNLICIPCVALPNHPPESSNGAPVTAFEPARRTSLCAMWTRLHPSAGNCKPKSQCFHAAQSLFMKRPPEGRPGKPFSFQNKRSLSLARVVRLESRRSEE
jgi:hypothetical protein